MGSSPFGKNLGGRRAITALAFVLTPAGAAPATASAPAPPAVVALAQRGLGGDFEATYKVSGQLAIFPGPQWTVVVAHQGPAPVSGPLRASGAVWSFFLHAGQGYQLQWIEHGQHFEDCWTTRTQPGWHCSQGTYEPSNGFSMATLPYVPATALADVTQAVGGEPPSGQHLTVTRGDSPVFGRLTCLTSISVATADLPGRATTRHPFSSTCFTARGPVASQHQWGEGTWDDLVLVGLAPRAQASDFRPVSNIGPSSELPPL
jgi:hypothetical protein